MPGSEAWNTISILMKRDETIQSHQKGVSFTYSYRRGIGNRIINWKCTYRRRATPIFDHGSWRYPNDSKLTSVREREQPRAYPEGYKKFVSCAHNILGKEETVVIRQITADVFLLHGICSRLDRNVPGKPVQKFFSFGFISQGRVCL